MRDLNVATLLGDIVEGVPVAYSTFVGYDEVAHHSGIEQPDAFAVLKQHDARLERLERAVEQAPRPTTSSSSPIMVRARAGPFASATAWSLGSWCKAGSPGGNVYAPAPLDEGLSSVGGALTDARDEDTAAGRVLARATRDQVVDGDVVIGPKRRGRRGDDARTPRAHRRGPRLRWPRADLPARARPPASRSRRSRACTRA